MEPASWLAASFGSQLGLRRQDTRAKPQIKQFAKSHDNRLESDDFYFCQ